MKAKRIFLAVLLTAALSVSCAAPAVLAEHLNAFYAAHS